MVLCCLLFFTSVQAADTFHLFSPDKTIEVVIDTNKTLTRSDPLFTSYRNPSIPDPVTGRPSPQTYTSTYTSVSTTAPREFGINVRYAFGSR